MTRPKEGQFYDGRTKEQDRQFVRERREAAKASVRLHKPKVKGIKIEEDYIHHPPEVTVEFTLPTGERVSGNFMMTSWGRPPQELIPTAEQHRDLARKRVPMVFAGRPNRGQQEQ